MKSKIRFSGLTVLLAAICFLSLSCTEKVRIPTSQLDTPEHHFNTGIRLLDQGKLADADSSFDKAIQLSSKFSMAFVGKGLVKAYQNDFITAFDNLKTAWKFAKTDEEKILVHVGYIRVNTLSNMECMKVGIVCKPQSDWLSISRQEFDKAVAIDPQKAAPYYFMGLCYKTALDINKAGEMFKKVLEIRKDYVSDADREWKLIQKVQRAQPGTITGKQIAFVERITRADVAAVLMEELKIDVLYNKRTPKTFDTTFKGPEKNRDQEGVSVLNPNDIADHPLKADVEAIIQIGVRGLETYPDGSFRPDGFIDRATYAMIIEDILIKVTGDNALATRFIGSVSPFPDLRPDLPYFNAVMVVTSRGIMESKNITTGEFAPLDGVPGVDALLIIRKIKEELKLY